MRNSARNVKVLSRHSEVTPYLSSVIAASDANKDALGFWAGSVFKEFARRDQLLVAAEERDSKLEYVGHLLFDCRFPKSKVLQIYSAPSHRGKGIARTMLDELKSMLTLQGFTSIYARVAEDLIGANAFWGGQHFYIQRVAPGGVTRNRKILVRCHELESPQLFPRSGLTNYNPLGLNADVESDVPVFLLDLNVLYDLGPRRPRNVDAVSLFQIERSGSCRLAVSSELSAELSRTATPGRTDPMLSLARVFATFPHLISNEWDDVRSQLAAIVFPEKARDRKLTDNDQSDLRHLTTAIQHRLSGFITNDTSILGAAGILRERYGIQVLSPGAFKLIKEPDVEGSKFETARAQTLTLQTIRMSDAAQVHTFLSDMGLPGSALAAGWAPVDSAGRSSTREGAWLGDKLLGYLTWPAWTANGGIEARVAVAESFTDSPSVAHLLIGHLLEQVSTRGATEVRLDFPPNQSHVREAAWARGFRGTSDRSTLCKVTLNGIVTPSNWTQWRTDLFTNGRLKLPEKPPAFTSIDQQIPIQTPGGDQTHVSLNTLETLLSPALFCLPNRGAVITPVQRTYAEHLLGHLRQRPLLAHSKAALNHTRNYLSGARTLKHFKRGSLILFYESGRNGGVGGVVAVARVRQAYLKSQDNLESSDLDASVLDLSTLETIGSSKVKTVTVFDNLIHLRKPVLLKTLKDIGCGRSNDLISTKTITDQQFQMIILEGTSCD
jgi:GNAT superfamily N-acetyltransferase